MPFARVNPHHGTCLCPQLSIVLGDMFAATHTTSDPAVRNVMPSASSCGLAFGMTADGCTAEGHEPMALCSLWPLHINLRAGYLPR